jgi:hypothetical protein
MLRCLLYSYLHFSGPETWNRLDGAVLGHNSDICQMLSTRGISEPARSAGAEQMEEFLMERTSSPSKTVLLYLPHILFITIASPDPQPDQQK